MIRLTEQDNIVTLTLNRPGKRNALSLPLIQALHQTLDEVESNDSMRAFILAGEGRTFCAGMDLKGVLEDPVAMKEMLRLLSIAFKRIRTLPVPTIACVQGAAIGGGCGLMIVCDFSFTHPQSKVGYPEVDLGVCPAVVAPWLMKKIGAGNARSMLLAGGTISGEQGFAAGLATHLCEQEALPTAVVEFAQTLTTGAKEAIAVSKQWLNELDGSLDEEILLKAAELSAQVIASEEAQHRLKPIYGV